VFGVGFLYRPLITISYSIFILVLQAVRFNQHAGYYLLEMRKVWAANSVFFALSRLQYSHLIKNFYRYGLLLDKFFLYLHADAAFLLLFIKRMLVPGSINFFYFFKRSFFSVGYFLYDVKILVSKLSKLRKWN
jgi:hypothetical protein